MTQQRKPSKVLAFRPRDKEPPPNELHYEVRGDTESGRVTLQVSCGNIRGRRSRKVSVSSFSALYVFRSAKTIVGIIVRDVALFFGVGAAPRTLYDLVCRVYLRDQQSHLHHGKLGRFAVAVDETVFAWLEPHESAELPADVVAQIATLHAKLASPYKLSPEE